MLMGGERKIDYGQEVIQYGGESIGQGIENRILDLYIYIKNPKTQDTVDLSFFILILLLANNLQAHRDKHGFVQTKLSQCYLFSLFVRVIGISWKRSQ